MIRKDWRINFIPLLIFSCQYIFFSNRRQVLPSVFLRLLDFKLNFHYINILVINLAPSLHGEIFLNHLKFSFFYCLDFPLKRSLQIPN